jgi:Zn-dependent M28 family amino/carboxypeptidase
MKKIIILFFLLVLAACEAQGQYSFNTEKLMLDVKILSSDSLEGRKTGTEGCKKARAYIIEQLKKAGVQPFVPGYTQPFSVNQVSGEGVNILGFIPGKKNKTIVISAHYDHLGIRNNTIYNGADDNASGTAALLAMIQYFKKTKPQHRLIFAFFDAEEMGLKGSNHFVGSLDLSKENIVLNINLDMVSRSDKNELYASGTYHNPKLKKSIETIKVPNGVKILFGHDEPSMGKNDWTKSSDHYNFHKKEIPFIYFGVEDHADYHKPGDDFEKINLEFYKNSTEMILSAVRALDKSLE